MFLFMLLDAVLMYKKRMVQGYENHYCTDIFISILCIVFLIRDGNWSDFGRILNSRLHIYLEFLSHSHIHLRIGYLYPILIPYSNM